MTEPTFAFQLVFQFPCHSIQDYSRMIQLEDQMEHLVNLQELGVMDGHDASESQMDIFILTNHPQETFAAIQHLVTRLFVKFKSAYRRLEGEEYTVLYSAGEINFEMN